MTEQEYRIHCELSMILLGIPEDHDTIKDQQVEACWAWHDDPDGEFDRAERLYWANMPCKPLY